ncbi:MAG: CopG family transcriptional regulator [Limnochordia bacterium]
MARSRHIVVSLPETLLQQLKQEIQGAKMGRNEFICESVEYYMAERKRRTVRRQLVAGYQEMAALNLELAGEAETDSALGEYEQALSEGE